MECPICHQPMEVYQARKTYSKTGTEYEHQRLVCHKDDVWMRLEMPTASSKREQEEAKR